MVKRLYFEYWMSNATIGIDALGYEDQQKNLYTDALSRPQGMI